MGCLLAATLFGGREGIILWDGSYGVGACGLEWMRNKELERSRVIG